MEPTCRYMARFPKQIVKEEEPSVEEDLRKENKILKEINLELHEKIKRLELAIQKLIS